MIEISYKNNKICASNYVAMPFKITLRFDQFPIYVTSLLAFEFSSPFLPMMLAVRLS